MDVIKEIKLPFEELAAQNQQREAYIVLAAVRDEENLPHLLTAACALAQAHAGRVRLLTVTRSGAPPPWLTVSEEDWPVPIEVVVRSGANAQAILKEVKQSYADVLILGWSGRLSQGRYLLGKTLDPVLQKAACQILVLRCETTKPIREILIPASGGPNAPAAFKIARALAPDARITALYVAPEHLGNAGMIVGKERLETLMEELEDTSNIHLRLIVAEDSTQGILEEANQGYDLMLLGAGRETLLSRFIFGDVPQRVLLKSPIPVVVIRNRLTGLHSLRRKLWAHLFELLPKVSAQEQADVFKTVRRATRPSIDFFVTLTLASAFASLGLLLDSPAVIIGAMMVAPLMTTILGMGLSIIMGEPKVFWRALTTTLRGCLLATLMGFIVGLLAPGTGATHEMMAYAQPTLLDLAVALIAGTTASYAISRKDVSAAFAGVAVAAALTPPLANAGLTIALQRWDLAGGAILLFLANMVAIVAASGLVFILLGFYPHPEKRGRSALLQWGFRTFSVLLLAVTIPLAILTRSSVAHTHLNRAIEAAIRENIQQTAGIEVTRWEIIEEDEDSALHLNLTIDVPTPLSYEEGLAIQEHLAERLGQPVALSLSMIPIQKLDLYIPPSTSSELPPPLQEKPIAELAAGADVYYSPDGLVVGELAAGTDVWLLHGPIQHGEHAWYQVETTDALLQGWVTADNLLIQAY